MKNPWFPFYIADYLSKTLRLTTLQHGAYLLLIIEYYQRGKLPTDDASLALIAGLSAKEWAANRAALAKYFKADWTHDRCDEELARAESISQKRKNSADKRWNAERGDKIINFPAGEK